MPDSTTTTNHAAVARSAEVIGSWTLDASDSTISFAIKSLWGLMTERGGFDSVSGSAAVTADGDVGGQLFVDAESVDTGKAKRDDHLRTADFFDVERFPQMSVRIDRVDLSSEARGTAHGQLTILGQTKPVDFEVRIERDGDVAVVSGELTIDRGAFGMSWRPMKMVAMDVDVSFRLTYRHAGS